MGSRFLPGLDAYGLGKHINRDGLVSAFKFAIAAKTEQILQANLPAGRTATG